MGEGDADFRDADLRFFGAGGMGNLVSGTSNSYITV